MNKSILKIIIIPFACLATSCSIFGPKGSSVAPSVSPSVSPSVQPSVTPSEEPSVEPSVVPSLEPSIEPSVEPSEEESEEHSHEHSISVSEVPGEEMSINFLEFETRATGDCTFIKAGDIDILIDAGSIQSSAKTIKNFVDQYCTDNKLEYVIATHAHKDHISGFVGTSNIPGIFDAYEIDTLIDFSLTNSTSNLYESYVNKRNAGLESNRIKNHYTANECIQEINGAQKEYTITDSIKMTILDQKYYRNSSSDENNYSVCTLFTHNNNNHYLFTGDLEKEGEHSLVELNELPHVQLFKGGHHGSATSNTDELLSIIQPEVVCICCCAGSDEYTKNVSNQFPTQAAINNIAKWTDQIFVTSLSINNETKEFGPMNGNITFYSEKGYGYIVTGSNNSTILKETDWFKSNRTWPE